MAEGRIRRMFVHVLLKLVHRLRILGYSLLSSNLTEGRLRRLQPLQAAGLGRILFGERVSIRVFPSPKFLSTYAYSEARNPSAVISIDSDTWINNSFSAIAEHFSISTGSNCFIGGGVEILDSDFHGLKISQRRMSLSEWARPVTVGDEVFIGSNVKIMKGIVIGNGSFIAGGSVVTRNIPAGVVAGGSPAIVIREIA